MDSSRVERLAAAVATMPDGPSRDRFVDLLEELNEPEVDDQPAADERGLDDTDPGDPIRDATGEAAPRRPYPEHPYEQPDAAPEVSESIDVPEPPGQLPPTAATPQPPAEEPTKKRRWRKKD